MKNFPELATGTGVAAVFGAAWRFLRTEAGKAFLSRFRKSVQTEAVSLREAIDNLAQVVTAQGESIEWLRSELDRTRAELSEARKALNDKESRLEEENRQLKGRVAELEGQVKALEAALAARKRRTKKEAA